MTHCSALKPDAKGARRLAVRAASLAAALLAGCAVQVIGGVPARHAHATPVSMDLGGRIHATRSSGVFAGTDVVMAVPRGGSFGLRHGLITGGYRWLGHPFSLELGADLGAGEPALLAWNGSGFYLGASSALLVRIWGRQDTDVGYAPIALLLDVVLSARGGVWSRPQGDHRTELGDGSLLLGLRLSGISDIAVASNRSWSP